MALTQVYAAVAGHVITAARWNNEFGNIYANGTDLAFPLTKAVSLAGWTLTLDGAGATTLLSTASQGFIFSAGAKSGTPSVNGSFAHFSAATFTDTATVASGTATLWAGTSFRIPTLAAANASVTTTDAATVYIEGAPTAGTNETLTETSALLVDGKLKVNGDIRLRTSDNRTNTVIAPLTVQVTTGNTPAAGIGVGISFHAESQDENPCVLGRTDFALSDVTAGSEDSYFDILLRTAGAAVSTAWRWVRTTAFKGIFTHSNTADRTYTLPDFDCTLGSSGGVQGPTSTGTGSTMAHEGTVTISANQALDGIHFYTNFTLDAGKTVTLDNNSHRLIIVASDTITINGTIDAVGAGSPGGTGGTGAAGTAGSVGFSQPGGGANGATTTGQSGGGVYFHAILRQAGGAGGGASAPGSSGTTVTGDGCMYADLFSVMGGAGGAGGEGAGGGGNTGGNGGRGGGSVVLIAPNIIFGAAAVINTSGDPGTAPGNGDSGAGGGGGAGNIYIACNTLTDGGVTYVQNGGAGSSTGPPLSDSAGDGAAGIKQILIYG